MVGIEAALSQSVKGVPLEEHLGELRRRSKESVSGRFDSGDGAKRRFLDIERFRQRLPDIIGNLAFHESSFLPPKTSNVPESDATDFEPWDVRAVDSCSWLARCERQTVLPAFGSSRSPTGK